jgi:YbbR domain-containing protein
MKWYTTLSIMLSSRLRNNMFLKILSLCIALSIWLWVQVNEEKSISAKLALKYKLPDDLVEVSEPPKAILVELHGPKGRIRQLNNTVLYTMIDLVDSIEGNNNIDLSVQQIDNIPEGVTISRYIPPILDIVLDKPMIRDVQIRPNIVGSPQKGLKITKITIEPTSFTIKGARQLLKNITEVKTEAINVDQISESRTFKTSLSLPSKTLIAQHSQQISVKIEVASNIIEREFTQVKVVLNDDSKSLDPPEVTVTMTLKEDKLPDLPSEPILQVTLPDKKEFSSGVVYNKKNASLFTIVDGDKVDAKILSIEPSTFTFREKDE